MRSPRLPLFSAGFVLVLLAVLSHFVDATYGSGAPTPPPVQPNEVPAAERGRLTLVDGLPVARLKGTPFEMGRQHGRLFRDQIHFLVREYYEGFSVKLIGARAMEEWAARCEPFLPDAYRQELRGLAEGAGLSYETVLRVQCSVDRMQMAMCSTLVAGKEATKEGEILFGRNLDFPGRNILQRATIVLVFEAPDAPAVAAVTWPGLIGVLSGMNEHGVCGATMAIHPGKPARPGVPYMLMYRDALLAARKAGDVGDHIAKTKRTVPNNFTVVDAAGVSEVLEFDADRIARRPADRGAVCSTNFFVSELLRDTKWKVGTRRYETLETFLREKHGRIDVEGVRQALRDTATPFFLNVQAMIFLPRLRALEVAVGDQLPAAHGRYVRLDRKRLFGD
ncbi:MAG: C45 family peptidase [Planctomycetota bacterium]